MPRLSHLSPAEPGAGEGKGAQDGRAARSKASDGAEDRAASDRLLSGSLFHRMEPGQLEGGGGQKIASYPGRRD